MNLSYEDWMKQVDIEVQKITGTVGVYDLADWLSRDAYEAEVTPQDAAYEAIENDGTFDECLDLMDCD
jgi:hypothetical protein